MYHDTQLHIMGDARSYASTTRPLKQETNKLLLIQKLYNKSIPNFVSHTVSIFSNLGDSVSAW